MAARTFWNGYLKLSLVTCPVAMMPATSESEKVRFHTLNRKTGHRVVSEYLDAVSGKPVPDDDQAKGYPRGEDDYVLLSDDDLDAVNLESNRTIDIEKFVPADSVGWIWHDKPHFLTPNDPVGEEAFSVIREAMTASETVGIARVVLYRRERAVMLEPRGKGIVLWTLRYGDEVRNPKDYFGDTPDRKVDRKQLDMITRLIDERTTDWKPEMAHDPIQTDLLKLIEARKKGRKKGPKAKTAAEEKPSNVVSIMDALRKSVKAEAGKRK
jgi:DNA end-binding protein Ku